MLRKKRFRNPKLRQAKSKTEAERESWKRLARKALANDDSRSQPGSSRRHGAGPSG